jgi:uncharacterized NAD(P)/FAD-binding protein YdhS
MKTRNELAKQIVIIGGGVSGALTALHLDRLNTSAAIVLIDQRPDFGLGLAYSTPSLRHLLNVPAGKISALPDQPNHFLNWLQANYDPMATKRTFAPRAIFGRYIQSLLALASRVQKVQAYVTDVRPSGAAATITLDNGDHLHADVVVLATGNFDPAALPGIASEAIASGQYHHNAWSKDTCTDLPVDAPIAIIGTGLTGVDVTLRLRELGHKGKIIAVSRHGVFPSRHTDYEPEKQTAVPLDTPATALAYLRALRAAIGTSVEWRAAVDSIRSTTNALWLQLPIEEQKRFRRHLIRRWEVLRHRMAPPIADVIESELASGSLEIREGHLAAITSSPEGAHVFLRSNGEESDFYVNRVINCTGPSMNYRKVASPLLRSLFEQGVVTAGPLGAGFHCALNGAVIDVNGQTSETIYNLGPGRLGDLIESIAVPEIREQAVELARTIFGKLEAVESFPKQYKQEAERVAA